eukprot:scaffold324_cov239-Pinguiococcus_pyrenoidosus.AAC.4
MRGQGAVRELRVLGKRLDGGHHLGHLRPVRVHNPRELAKRLLLDHFVGVAQEQAQARSAVQCSGRHLSGLHARGSAQRFRSSLSLRFGRLCEAVPDFEAVDARKQRRNRGGGRSCFCADL